MAQFAAHPLLEKVGVMTASQQVSAVVGLDHQGIEVAVTVQHLRAVGTQVGEHAQASLAVAEYILRRLLGVVSDCDDTDAQRTDLQLLATGQETCGFNGFAHPAQRAATQVHRKIVAPRQQTHAMHVVGMFVGHQDRAQLRGVNPQAQQAPLGFP
ncbi:MAG: hypothetical protein K0S85_1099 [Pseudomonas orientalis]|nr:hypothetical protein [Pseudomonas orientalis]